jgi:acyl-coenzyme A synthetase/AMP-(fatty) acid ligase/pimeloyl-ACP methyl ester carboxylesterase
MTLEEDAGPPGRGAPDAPNAFTAAATTPPPDITGIDPSWSRLIHTPKLDGVGRTWHVLDNDVADPAVTLLCVHGNPTWSYLWRHVLARADPRVRVVAVDQLEMGFSERTGAVRRLGQRIDDLCALTARLHVNGPVVTVGHEWGGPISLGWAVRHRAQLDGVVLANTTLQWPANWRSSSLAHVALLPGVARRNVTTRTIIRLALELSKPRLARPIREAYCAPYASARRRAGIRDFVRDVPLSPSHPSAESLAKLVVEMDSLGQVPALLLWGPTDPLFPDACLRDLEKRLPRADVHRFVGAGHLVPEVEEFADALHEWFARLQHPFTAVVARTSRAPAWARLDSRAGDGDLAVVEMNESRVGRAISFAELHSEVRRVTASFVEHGVQSGDRVALLIPPGVDLTVCLYAAWQMGAVVVLVDPGLGASGIGRALASASPSLLIGVPRALFAARLLGWPGLRISLAEVTGRPARPLPGSTPLSASRGHDVDRPAPKTPEDSDPAAVIFTSGATGPAKGVSYRHHQLQAQRDTLARLFGIKTDDALVAAFPPFVVYGPALGVRSVVPDMRITAPGTLRAVALAEAADAIGGSLVFASPAALANVIKTAGELTPRHRSSLANIRLLLSAGAPVSTSLLRRASEILPNAEPHTPYGMTEVLPVSDITLAEIEAAGTGNGVCVGPPIAEVSVAISPLDDQGHAVGDFTTEPDTSGEVCIRAAHLKDGYDKLWLTQHRTAQPAPWHRSGDVGHLDHQGRLWIEGRMIHVITTATGPVTPVGIEQAVESLPDVDQAAAVGVGPAGTQHVVMVVVPTERPRRPNLAAGALAERVRGIVGVDIAAVFIAPALPVDRRHNSKIDRARVGKWASTALAGQRIRAL